MTEEEELQELAKKGSELTAHDIRHLTFDQRLRLAEIMGINVDQLSTFEKEAAAQRDDENYQDYENEQRKKNEW